MCPKTRLRRWLQLTAEGMTMGIEIKPSDLYFKYRRNKELRGEPKFTGKPDANSYDRDDLYDVIPMLAAVMDQR